MTQLATILYVDDDTANLDTFKRTFRFDYNIELAPSGADGLEILKKNREISVIISDQRMPKMTGVEFLEKAMALNPYAQRIMLTAFNDNEALLKAIQLGHVYDYVTKPWDTEALKKTINKALEIFEDRIEKIKQLKVAQTKNIILEEEVQSGFDDIIGADGELSKIIKQVEQVAPTDSVVLIRGETGTGKELIARAIHNQSRRKNAAFIKVNCAALSPTLIESELFGHEKGAFTNAVSQKMGRFELADKGTLFLDEIGDLPEEVQAKLLRVLQEKELERVGGTQPIKVDFRLVCATHQNLEERVKENKFRQDLYFRINVIPLLLPPLRERPNDIATLVNHFVNKFSREMGKTLSVSSDALSTLSTYDWPGNIRELSNVIERAVVLATDSQLTADDFALNPLSSQKLVEEFGQKEVVTLRDDIDNQEAKDLASALRKAKGNISTLSRDLNVARSTLVHRLKKYGLI